MDDHVVDWRNPFRKLQKIMLRLLYTGADPEWLQFVTRESRETMKGIRTTYYRGEWNQIANIEVERLLAI